ncbi:MAG TPA: hypothetical protein VLF21_03075 [Candidatus Saccharimonadales bacterium]|nr:hypothetical protein [Candidatus Saccharimonadales bacterium]
MGRRLIRLFFLLPAMRVFEEATATARDLTTLMYVISRVIVAGVTTFSAELVVSWIHVRIANPWAIRVEERAV